MTTSAAADARLLSKAVCDVLTCRPPGVVVVAAAAARGSNGSDHSGAVVGVDSVAELASFLRPYTTRDF
jgi:hypothetical protein